MKINELLKKPIGVVVENNISDDMIFPDTPTAELIDRALNKMSQSDVFLFVYVNDREEKKIKAIITSSELDALVGLFKSDETKTAKTVNLLNLETAFPPRFLVDVSEPIQTLLTIFNTQKTDVVVVKSSTNTYLGKVRRTKLKEWFEIMKV